MVNKSRNSTVQDACERILKTRGLEGLEEAVNKGLFGPHPKEAESYVRKLKIQAALPGTLSTLSTLAAIIAAGAAVVFYWASP